MVDQITIDEGKIVDLKNRYATLDSDSNLRLSMFAWSAPAVPTVRMNLSTALRLSAGADTFAPAADLKTQAEGVRTRMLDRLTKLNGHADNLYWGLEYLLENTDGTETLNDMTAADFGAYVPANTTA